MTNLVKNKGFYDKLTCSSDEYRHYYIFIQFLRLGILFDECILSKNLKNEFE